MSGQEEPLDWHGNAVDCALCPHREWLASGDCEKGKVCIQDRRSNRIDRFLRAHPELAGPSLQEPYFLLRALAARHANLFQLPSVVDDPDPEVRVVAAERLPQRFLLKLRSDPDPRVR
ncbi:MAG TPA: 4Fe4S-binding leucine-rich repeat protein, partial [Telmatospirillum sp.]|nr:4Fe4S-binding leucine-rich repeat protein [Telmatospirillum sp.]